MRKDIETSDYCGEERRDNIDWHQTKGLSLSIIILLIINIVSTVWWAATLTNDVSQIKGRPDLTERVIKLEAKIEVYNTVLNRLTTVLEKLDNTVDRIDREQVRRGPRIKSLERKVK